MFEVLMKMGGYRVDYLNRQAAGSPEALGFYVRGQLNGQPYSREAKRHFYAGMMAIQQELGSENLVSVYLDVNEPGNLDRPAYVQMKNDLRRGLFRKIFAFNVYDLLGHPADVNDLRDLYLELGGFELVSFQQGKCRPASLFKFGSFQPNPIGYAL